MNVRSSLAAAFLIEIALYAPNAFAVKYTATILHPSGAFYSEGLGIAGSTQVGYTLSLDFVAHAAMWTGTAGSAVALHPVGYTNSSAVGVANAHQVGWGDDGGYFHPLLWNGTAASAVDLTPSNLFISDLPINDAVTTAIDTTSTSQVGWGKHYDAPIGTATHALLWHGTAASAIDLHSSSYENTFAADVWGNSQVGYSHNFYQEGDAFLIMHALLWNGTAESVVDLGVPEDYSGSVARGVWGSTQVGQVWYRPYAYSAISSFAAMWSGTPESLVNLHPGAGFPSSEAFDVSRAGQVGWSFIEVLQQPGAFVTYGRAGVWYGTADSYVDLHESLLAVEPTAATSTAYSISDDGMIIGTGGGDGRQYAVLWKPIADFNENTSVDAADYVLWRKGLGTTYNESHYDLWRSHFGQPAGSGTANGSASAAVPEPASCALVTCALTALLLLRARPIR